MHYPAAAEAEPVLHYDYPSPVTDWNIRHSRAPHFVGVWSSIWLFRQCPEPLAR